ncbi:MAG: Kae1-associated kinase Bud32 [Candidatus Thorarchaeota archaeon]|jgi:TP53 regulating kinase-like protein
MLARGAESIIFKVEHWGRSYVLKWRQSKSYLLDEIDTQLRGARINRECKMLTFSRTLGVPTPAVYSVDLERHTILMDFIDGTQFKQLTEQVPTPELVSLCQEFGRLIALLHRGNVVHGDPTTSNVIVDHSTKLWLVDFGLSEMNATLETKGVDLHLIQRALETTHWNLQETMLEATLEGYIEIQGESAEPILTRMKEIRERGRYH